MTYEPVRIAAGEATLAGDRWRGAAPTIVLLHAGVALRVAGDLAQAPSTLAAGGIANAVAIVAFIATAAASVARGRRASRA